MRKFLLWDHDGVLVDTERWYFAATQQCLAGLGVSLDQNTYLEFMAQGRSCWELARNAGLSDQVIAKAKGDRDTLYQKFLREQPIEIPGVLEVLSQLHRHYRMAVVTTARRADLEVIHRERDILGHFEFVLTCEDCTHHKPHPAPYLQALRRFEASAHEAIAIEDSSRGLQSAVSAGIDCVVVRNDFTASQDFSKAWAVVPSIARLPQVLSPASE
ncbi:MAG TPA: HAD family hydrolase [Tepidisphaeraceae bacterium]|jgi:HAD superfamily hydrolase (TIGR01509 family)